MPSGAGYIGREHLLTVVVIGKCFLPALGQAEQVVYSTVQKILLKGDMVTDVQAEKQLHPRLSTYYHLIVTK